MSNISPAHSGNLFLAFRDQQWINRCIEAGANQTDKTSRSYVGGKWNIDGLSDILFVGFNEFDMVKWEGMKQQQKYCTEQ